MDKVGKFFIGALVTLGALITTGYAKMLLWNWFIAPIGFIEINFLWAIGIGLAITAFKGVNDSKRDYGKDEFLGYCVTSISAILWIWVLVAIGAIVRTVSRSLKHSGNSRSQLVWI